MIKLLRIWNTYAYKWKYQEIEAEIYHQWQEYRKLHSSIQRCMSFLLCYTLHFSHNHCLCIAIMC